MNNTDTRKWEIVDEVMGNLQAEIIKGLLESYDIKVSFSQEAASSAIGLNTSPFGRVQIIVPRNKVKLAKEVLASYYSKKTDEFQEPE